MSIFNEGARGDIAVSRAMLIDNTEKNSRGETIYRVLPWQIVSYENGRGGTTGLEPVSTIPAEGVLSGGLEVEDNDRHPTSIVFISEDEMFQRLNVAGDIGFPRR